MFSVPTTYDEPKGMFLLEALANGVPVVQPRRGAFPEIVSKTGGGLLVGRDDPAALADGLPRVVARSRSGPRRWAAPAPPACASTTTSAAWPKRPSAPTGSDERHSLSGEPPC